MKSDKNILKSVHASLQYGQYFTGMWTILFYSLIIYCTVLILSCFVWLILVKCGIEPFNDGTLLSMICTLSISALIILGVLFVIYKNNKLKKHILLCLNDAVMLQATTQVIDSFRTYGHPVAETKLMVEFFYDGKIIRRESGDKTKKDHWYKRNGYFKILSKYANRTVYILYSPSYDQVFILKNKLLPNT